MKTNQEYKNAALAALDGKWAPSVICTIVFVLVAGAFSATGHLAEDMNWGLMAGVSAGSLLLSVFVLNPLSVGFYNVFKEVYMKGEDKVTAAMFRIGYDRVLRNGLGMLLMQIFIMLWCILLVIPGLIKSFSYALTPYILVDNPELTPNQAINLSRKMMKGHKFDLFWLELSFIGWILLGIVTLGIGYFWLMPYMYTSVAAFYEDVRKEYAETLNL